MQESWILFLIQFFQKKNSWSSYNIAYCKKRNCSNKLYMNKSITTRRRNNEKKSFDCDKSIFFCLYFYCLNWKTQDDVALATCKTQYTWVWQLAKPKVMWAWQYARPNTFRFTNQLHSRQQYGPDEMSNSRLLDSIISWVQGNMSLVKCETQETWV